MVFLAALLAGAMAVLFFLGLKELFKRDIKASRFSAFRYNAEEEMNRESLAARKKAKNEKARDKLVVILSTVTFTSFALIITGELFMAVFAGFLGFIAPKVLKAQTNKKSEKLLATQLEQALEVMSMVLNSGGGMTDALDKAILSVGQPLRKELEQASAELKLGVSEAEVFRRLADRVKMDEIEMISIAEDLQEDGMTVNMTSVLKQSQNSILSRQAFFEEIKAITSENRMAVWVVACVPVATIGIIRLFSPEFIEPLFNTFLGIATLVICSILIIIGIIWALKIADSNDFV